MLQPAEIFLDRSGEEIRRRTFTLTDPSGRDLCLRPDLTIPICQHAVDVGRANCPRASAIMAWSSAISRPSRIAPPNSSRRAWNCWAWRIARPAKPKSCRWRSKRLRAAGLEDFRLRIGDLALFGALVDALDCRAQWRARLKRHFWRAGYVETLLHRLGHGDGAPSCRARAPRSKRCWTQKGDAPPAGRTRDEIVARAMDAAAEAAALRLDPAIADVIAKLLGISGPAEDALAEIRALLKTAGIKLWTRSWRRWMRG